MTKYSEVITPSFSRTVSGRAGIATDDVLDELTALRAAWYAAYRGKAAPATAAIEWPARWLPGRMARCKTAIKARPCDRDGHQSPPKTEASCDSVAFTQFTESGPER